MGQAQLGVRVWVVATLANLTLLSSLSLADAAADSVSAALDEQEAWLAGMPNGAAWQEFLGSAALRSELSKGDRADRRVIARVLGRYTSRLPGLEQARFETTRRQLTAWANALRVPLALRWAARARAAAVEYEAIDEQQLRQARAELIDAVVELDGRFAASPDRDKERGWKRFLVWDELQRQLQAESPDWTKLQLVGARFYDGHPGLELPEFVKVREALRKFLFLGALSDQTEEARHQAIAGQLNQLADALAKYNDFPTAKTAGATAALGNWMDQLGRVPGLAAEMRGYHRRPNLMVKVSEEFISRRFDNDVDDVQGVSEVILKTRVRGTARTRGRISADIVPSSNSARVDVLFRGATDTDSVGRQSPVTIYSRSRTSIAARKSLMVSAASVEMLPSTASCDTRTNIFDIVPDGRFAQNLIRHAAWKRASQQKPRAERIASRRAETRVQRQIDRQTAETLRDTQREFQEQVRRPWGRRGLIPEEIDLSSTDRDVFVTVTQAHDRQFAAAGAAPDFPEGKSLAVLVHESSINNTAEIALAGMRLTDERIAELVQELTGSVPEELQLSETKARWSIAFDWQQPITVEFRDQMMNLAVRGRGFTSGDNTLTKVMEMSADYKMETSPSGVVLTRQGDIAVEFPGQREGQRPSNREIFFRSLMRTKFAALFKPEIRGEGLSLPGRWKSTGRLVLDGLSTRGGWLSLSWN